MKNLYFNKPMLKGVNKLQFLDANTGKPLVDTEIDTNQYSDGKLPPVTRELLAEWPPNTGVVLNEVFQGTIIQCFDERAS